MEKLAAAERKFAQAIPPVCDPGCCLLFVGYIAAKQNIAPALNTLVGGPSRMYERSRRATPHCIGSQPLFPIRDQLKGNTELGLSSLSAGRSLVLEEKPHLANACAIELLTRGPGVFFTATRLTFYLFPNLADRNATELH